MRDQAFHAPAARVRWFSDLVLSAIPDVAAPLHALDIGCGTGDQIFDLADRAPTWRFVGVDVSTRNVEIAERRRATRPDARRFTFLARDVRSVAPDAPFDVVLCYSVLHLVPGGADTVGRQVAELVAPGGVFVNTMPSRVPYNRGLAAVRRLLRLARSPVTDWLLLSVARLVHGGALDEQLIAERIPYAYMLPLQFEDEVARAVEGGGLRTLRRGQVDHASLAQMKHVFRVMRRDARV